MIRFLVLFLVAVICVRSLDAMLPSKTTDVQPKEQFRNDHNDHMVVAPQLSTKSLINGNIHPAFASTAYDNSNDDFPRVVSQWPNVPTDFKFGHPIQSPVDVITSLTVTKALPVLDIIETHLQGQKAIIYNSGHTVYIYIKENLNRRPYLIGGPLKTKFIFEQMHFHWGSQDIWGSEHFIDGESFSVEIHMVHFNSKYNTFKNAADKPDGLAVLAIFAEATKLNNTLLDPLEKLLPFIQEPKSQAMIDAWDGLKWAASALSTNDQYYTYPGSLTTEPYTENVRWIVLPKPITLSHEQLSDFRQLHSNIGDINEFILDNKRNLQPLYHRPIVRSVYLQ